MSISRRYRRSGLQSMNLLIGSIDRVQTLAWVRVSFTRVLGPSLSDELADLVLSLDETAARLGGSQSGFDGEVYRVKDVGVGAPVHLRVQADEIARWRLGEGQRLSLTWTNPDVGRLLWKMEAELRDA